MILPYPLRLLCLCCASFFVLNAGVALLVVCASKSAIRFAQSKAASAAARFLLALRVLPLSLAVLFVLAFCVPSYLRFEPRLTSERVGALCLLFGLLGAATWCLSLARTAHSLLATVRHNHLCRLAGQETRISGKSSTLVVVETEAPLLAMFGLLRPRLLVSRRVLRALSAEELDAALSHEHAHHASRDNAKRLLFLLTPDLFPFVRPLRILERQWSKFAEWAADDEAAAGDSLRALSLASALIQVARMGDSPSLPVLSTSLLASDQDLSARVDRLLRLAPIAPARTWLVSPLFRAAAFLLAGCLAVLLFAPASLYSVHELLELLLR